MVVCRIAGVGPLSVCIHVCSGVQRPRPASVGKFPQLLTVCLDTVYPCSDCRSQSGLCALMYSSCSFSLPLLPYCSSLLSFSSSRSFSRCLFSFPESFSSQTRKHSQHTEAYEHQSIHAHMHVHVHAHALVIHLHSGMCDWQYLRQLSARDVEKSHKRVSSVPQLKYQVHNYKLWASSNTFWKGHVVNGTSTALDSTGAQLTERIMENLDSYCVYASKCTSSEMLFSRAKWQNVKSTLGWITCSCKCTDQPSTRIRPNRTKTCK